MSFHLSLNNVLTCVFSVLNLSPSGDKYCFEFKIRSRKLGGFYIYVIYCFFYTHFLNYRDTILDITTIIITSNDNSHINYNKKLREISCAWGLL